MSNLCPHSNSFPKEDKVWWVSGGEKAFTLVVRDLWRKYDWREPNRLLIVQTGESVNQAKVFRAHAVPQGLCGNLIDALKFLAKQQEDGDGVIQNIVTNLGEESREELTNGLRECTQVDNHRAVEVGHLSEGLGTFLNTKAEWIRRISRGNRQGEPR